MEQSALQKLKNQWVAATRDEEKLAAHLVLAGSSIPAEFYSRFSFLPSSYS